jgi:ABC-type branched-subunit amino acid transport system substrate-binding protein
MLTTLCAPVAANTPGEIVFGQSIDLSGAAAQLGKDAQRGAKVYFDYVNSKGGVHGRKIIVHYLDDANEGVRSAANTRKFIEEDKVFAVFGYLDGPTIAAALPLITAAKVPLIGPFNGNSILRKPNRYVFHVRASFFDEGDKMIEQLTSLGMTKIAALYPDDPVGNAAREGTDRSMKQRGLQLVSSATYKRDDKDLGAAVKTIYAGNPQAVILISQYRIASAFIKQAKQMGFGAQYMTLSVVGPTQLVKELGDDSRGIGTSQVVPFPFVRRTALVTEYQSLMRASGNQEFSFTSLESFMIAKVIVEGLKRAGPNPTREKYIDALEGISKFDLGGVTISFSPNDHNGGKYVEINVIGKGGKFID